MGFLPGRRVKPRRDAGPYPGALLPKRSRDFAPENLTDEDREYLGLIWPMFTGKIEALNAAWAEAGKMYLPKPWEMLTDARVVVGLVDAGWRLTAILDTIKRSERTTVEKGEHPAYAHAASRIQFEMAVRAIEVYRPDKHILLAEVFDEDVGAGDDISR